MSSLNLESLEQLNSALPVQTNVDTFIEAFQRGDFVSPDCYTLADLLEAADLTNSVIVQDSITAVLKWMEHSNSSE